MSMIATELKNPHVGSTLNSLLEEVGIKDQVDELTLKKLVTCEVCDKMFGVHFADIDVCWGHPSSEQILCSEESNADSSLGHEVPVKGIEI